MLYQYIYISIYIYIYMWVLHCITVYFFLFSPCAVDLSEDVAGERTMAQWFEPHFWYVVYADQFTCTAAGEKASEDSPVRAELVFLNPDSSGQPRNHFGVDESGKKQS